MRRFILMEFILPQAIVTIAALILASIPLFDVLGFESSVAIGALLAYLSGWVAVGSAATARGNITRRNESSNKSEAFPGGDLLVCLARNASLLILPLLILSLNALRVPNCDWRGGLLFYGVIVIPGMLYGTALGYLLGLRFPARRGRLLFVLWSLATYAWVLWNILLHPPIFGFNAFVAFFPGPLYDRVITLQPRLFLARGMVLLETVFFLCLATLLWNGHRLELRNAWRSLSGVRVVPGLIAVAALATFLALQGHANQLGLRIDREYIQQTLGGRIETRHCVIYYATTAYSPVRAAELAAEHEFHYRELKTWFGTEPDRKLRSYVYASAHQKKRLMGAAGTNFEDALNDEFHINAARFPHPVLRHEMAHIFAAHIDKWWPVCPKMGIHEGLAVAADWRQAAGTSTLTPDEACVAMQQLGVLPDLQKTLGTFGFWTQASARAYTVSGSFLHYLVEAYGMVKMHRLWSSRDFHKTYGVRLDDLIGDWQQRRLDPVRLTPRQLRVAQRRYLRRSVFREPCAHEQARLRAAAAAALTHQPNVAESLYAVLAEIEPARAAPALSQMRARLRNDDADGALQLAEDLWQTAQLTAADSTRLWHLQGDAHWHRGEHDRAIADYEQALALAASRSSFRALQVNLAVLHDPQLRDILLEYLTETNLSSTAALNVLAVARIRSSTSPWPRYLMGRRLYFANRFEDAIEELQPLLTASFPTDVHLAVVELLAWAQLRSDQPHAALETLDGPAAAATGWVPAEHLRLEDLRLRAEAILP